MKASKKVDIIHLTKTFYTKDKTINAVNDVSFTVEPGEFVCLLGPSGCGKTTLLRMLAGFEIPTSGDIRIEDKDVSSLPPNKRDTAMVFQNYALFPHLNVHDNIAYGLKIQKRPKEEIENRVQHILDLMKMDDFAGRIPSQMSGGQQQRVSLARALIMNAGVLLLDEPLSNLDAKLRLHMRDEIRKIQQQVGITSIYVTHDQAEAMSLSDKIVIMKDGNIMQIGSPQEIYQKPNSVFVAKFIGRANIIQGTIIEKTNKGTGIELLGKIYTIKESHAHYEIGNQVEVVIRPESIDFDETQHKGEVLKSVFMGENYEYEVEVDGKIIEISLHDPHGKEIKNKGDMLSFGFKRESLHII